MKHIVKKLLLVIGVVAGMSFSAQAQQNIELTQYIFNSLSVNPAYAGYKESWFAQAALRNQWTGLDGAPKTGQVSIDGIADPTHKRIGLGLQITADKLGPQSFTSIYGNYAYRLQLDEADTRRLSFGIGLGVTQDNLNGAILDPNDILDPNLIDHKTNSLNPNMRFGVYYNSPKWYLGASVLDLFSNNKSIESIQRKRHFYLITGAIMPLSTNLNLRPSLLIKEDFKGPTSIDLNAMFIFYDQLWLGAAYRTSATFWDKDYKSGQTALRDASSVAGIVQFSISDRFRIGYSYDYALGSLKSAQNGTHELSLGFLFPQKTSRLLSPRFF